MPHLPVIVTGNYFEWDPEHPGYAAVKLRRYVTDDVQAFIVADHKPKPELWGWYSAYDHVALCQLFGSMVDLPEGIPMFTNDLKQEVQAIGNPRLPDMPDRREHHPLDDARECKYRREWLAEHYLDGKPRWPSMRLIRDVDDFRIQTGEDGTYLACPAVECSAYLLDYDEPLSEVLSKAY